MPDLHQYQDDDLFNPETHHESSDVPVRPLWWAVIIFIVFAVATHFVLYFLYKGFVKSERARMDPPQTQVSRPASASVPQNQPLLQPFPLPDVQPIRDTPVADLIDMRRAEESVLRNYGWVDRQKGVVRIPIDRAKALLVARLAVAGQIPAGGPPASSPAGAAPSSAPPATAGGAQP